jgi:hypothetical protein
MSKPTDLISTLAPLNIIFPRRLAFMNSRLTWFPGVQQILLGIISAGVLTACDAVVDPHVSASDLQVAVVYILYREYLHKNPGITRLSVDDPQYQQHMERRLRQLYPTRGYSGMMRDAVAERRRHEVTWRRYEQQLEQQQGVRLMSCETQVIEGDGCGAGGGGGGTGGGYEDPYADPLVDPSWDGQVEFAVPADEELPTIQMEVDTLMLDQAEVQEIYYYESLATGTYLTEPTQTQSVATSSSIDDLIRAAGAGHTPGQSGPVIQIVPDAVAYAVATLGFIGWKAFRVDQATKRAIARSAYYYHPALGYADTKRDAYRHILWSMMLRRYVGATFAKAITDKWEDHTNSSGAARVMDLHNNDIGRSYRYNRFRNHWLWDRWDWHEWALRVRDYINNEAENGAYIPEWYQVTIPTSEAWAREASVPDARYIYFAL